MANLNSTTVTGSLSVTSTISISGTPTADAHAINIKYFNNRIQYSTTQPTTRPDGTALQEGDIWLKPVST